MYGHRRFVVTVAVGLVKLASGGPFVPACFVEKCSAEARALGGDPYATALGKCASENFGQCPAEAWQCLGDSTCRSFVSCAPEVLKTCKADVWKMLTDEKEREIVMCLHGCRKQGKLNYFCALRQCGKAALACLTDTTCRRAAACVPKTLIRCSKAGHECLFGVSGVCRKNLRCFGNGIKTCSDPAVNILTDHRIGDFIECAGSKCPKPSGAPFEEANAVLGGSSSGVEPSNAIDQALCISQTCGSEVAKIFGDNDTLALLNCTQAMNLTESCSSVWQCLGDRKCAKAVQCWSQPLAKCATNTWHLLTDPKERKALAANVACLRRCEAAHDGDFVSQGFCVLDKCSKDLLKCQRDKTCWNAVQCLPQTAQECIMPTLDAYVNQPLFQQSVKCLGHGFQSCGRRAVGMVQDMNVARAVQCAAQCTRQPQNQLAELVI